LRRACVWMVLIRLCEGRAGRDCERGKSDQSKVGFHDCILVSLK
jgi:hypothetical protein